MTVNDRLPRIAVFASGSGTNFEAIARACADGEIPARIALCVTDRPGAPVEQRSARFGIPVLSFRPKDYASKADFETMLLTRLKAEGVELICLAGYMRLIGPVLLEAYGRRIINIHPALLPAFKGAHAIADAYNYGVKVTGVTIHYVDAGMDSGEIIAQEAVSAEGLTLEQLEERIHATEHRLYPATVARLLGGKY